MKTTRNTAKKTKRRSQSAEATKNLLLEVTMNVMLEEGYAAVSTRRVAKEAGVTSALVHYYYPATDDLLLALFHKTSEMSLGRLAKIMPSKDPLSSIWAAYSDPTLIALSAEFVALANHRKALRVELARYIETSRGLQAGILSQVLKDAGLDSKAWPPVGVSMLLAVVLRYVTIEKGLGINFGHREVEVILNSVLHHLTPPRRQIPAG